MHITLSIVKLQMLKVHNFCYPQSWNQTLNVILQCLWSQRLHETPLNNYLLQTAVYQAALAGSS